MDEDGVKGRAKRRLKRRVYRSKVSTNPWVTFGYYTYSFYTGIPCCTGWVDLQHRAQTIYGMPMDMISCHHMAYVYTDVLMGEWYFFAVFLIGQETDQCLIINIDSL